MTQGLFTKLFDLLEAACHKWDLQLACHYKDGGETTFSKYSAQLQELHTTNDELEAIRQSADTMEQMATYLTINIGESNSWSEQFLKQAEEKRQLIRKLVCKMRINRNLD